MNEHQVRIFVSSPSDLEHERALLKDIIASLAQEYRPYFNVEAVLWEEEALSAARSFQAGLLRPSECEIVLVMLWTRLGTPLADDPYGGMTGTEWEFVDAVEASARQGRPEVLVYQKTAPRLVDINDAETIARAVADRDRLAGFFQRHFFNPDGSFRRAFRQFGSDATFRDLAETQVRKLLNRRIGAERRFAAGLADWQGTPFRALRPFDSGDERVFTGRETETRELIARLDAMRGAGRGLLLLTGASGVGKSSLLRAGLLPHLTRPFLFPGVGGCRWCLIEPRADDPLQSLAEALAAPGLLGGALSEAGLDAGRLHGLLLGAPQVAAEQIQATLERAARERHGPTAEGRLRLALILDPLDALIDPSRPLSATARAFAATLAALAARDGIWVIATLREDRLAALEDLPELADALDEPGWYRLEAPAQARIRQVMEIPARIAGIEYEERTADSRLGLVEALESEASRTPHWPPLLQQTLEDLYRQALARATPHPGATALRLTLADYRDLGGLSGSLLRRARDLWSTLDPEIRDALPRLCRALLALDGERARPSAREGDLATLIGDPAAAALIEALTEARLLVVTSVPDAAGRIRCPPDEEDFGAVPRRLLAQIREEWRARRPFGPATPEPALGTLITAPEERPEDQSPAPGWRDRRAVASFIHPALIEGWEPLTTWLADRRNRHDLVLRHQISRQASLWKRTDCNREHLVGEPGFAAASRFAAAYPSELEPLEREFLDASWSRIRLQRRRDRAAIGAVLAIVLVSAGVAIDALREASHETNLNLQRGRLQEAAIASDRGNSAKALRLAWEAGRDLPAEATNSLARIVSSHRLLAMLPGTGTPRTLTFRDDGQELIRLDAETVAERWRLSDGRFQSREPLTPPGFPLQRVVFAGRDGETIIGLGATGAWRLPASADRSPDWNCGFGEDAIHALDPNGRFLAIAQRTRSEGGSLCLLDLSQPGEPLWSQSATPSPIRGLAFSPDGQRLVTAARDGVARVLNSQDGQQQRRLPREGSSGRPATLAVFSPDGRRLAVATLDERVRLFDQSGRQLAELGALRRGQRLLRIHQSAVRALAFSPDGDFLLAGDGAGQLVRWDTRTLTAEVLGHHDLGVDLIRISPEPDPRYGEHLVLSVSQDRTAHLWTLDTGRELAVLGQESAMGDARFSRDGRWIMTSAPREGSARLWTVEPRDLPALRLPQEDQVRHLAMAEAPAHPDGSRDLLMATATDDGRIELWTQAAGAESEPPVGRSLLAEPGERVRRIAFSPSARWLASAGAEGVARLWDLATGADCRLPIRPDSGACASAGGADCPTLYDLLFTPGDRLLVTASSDPAQPVRFWDPLACAALPLPEVLEASDEAVRSLAMGPDAEGERRLALGGNDGSLRLIRRASGGDWIQDCDLKPHRASIVVVRFSPNGRWIATASRDGLAALIPLAATGCGEPLHLDGEAGSLYDLDFAPDGEALVTAAFEAKAQVWSLDGRRLAELTGHGNRVVSASFSPDGNWILTASRDGSVRLWKRPLRASTGPLSAYLVLRAELGPATHARFTPNGRGIGAGYWGNAALLWRLWSQEADPDLVRHWGQERARLVVIQEAARLLREQEASADGAEETPAVSGE